MGEVNEGKGEKRGGKTKGSPYTRSVKEEKEHRDSIFKFLYKHILHNN